MGAKLRTTRAVVALAGLALVVAGCGGGSHSQAERKPGVPAEGESSTIDSILDRGTMRVGTLALPPWLIENTNGGSNKFHGASWILAKEYAKRLGVKLETVDVSQETKVTALQTKQIDVSITPLAETPERKAVVDFITYSSTADCYAGLKSNPKVAAISSVDDINDPNLTMAYFVGGSQENYLPTRFPKLKLRGVTGSGSGVPIEQLLSHRVDLVVFNTVEWPALVSRYPNLVAFPKNCEGSTEQKSLIGHAVDKGQPAFVKFLRGIEQDIHEDLQAEIKKDEHASK